MYLKKASLLLTTSLFLALTMGCNLTNPVSKTSVTSKIQTGDLIRSDFAPNELITLCQDAITRAQGRLDVLARISPENRTFDNTVLEFENTSAEFMDETQPLSFMKYVSMNPTTHAEGAQCEQLVGDFLVKVYGRRDLYLAMKDQAPRNDGEKRLQSVTLAAFEANGLKLPDDKLEKVTQLFSQLNELQAEFSDNLNNDATQVEFTAAELEGVSADFLSRLQKTADGQRYIVSAKVTDYTEVMENAKSENTRKQMLFAYNNRQGEANTKLLEGAIGVRQKIAALMGFSTWADYQLSRNRMAKTSTEVLDFLNGLKDKLAQRNKDDMAQLLAFKKTLDPSATQVNTWDINYLAYQLRKTSYNLDDELIREYFPSDHAVEAMFQVYSQILGVKYEQVAGAHTWSPDVKLYRIIDKKEGHLIGYFYTDFIPRPGKYNHFAAFTIINGRMLPGGYNQPVSAIVGNFNPPSNGKPSLLTHDDVVTLFHEFGHIMHQTLTRAPYASLSGSNVAQDFVESHSQMLENWVWEAQILNMVSGHYLDPSKKLPADLLKKMLGAKDYQQGYYYTRQLMLALTDMTYHTQSGTVDTAAVYNRLYKEMIGVDPIEGGHFAASFGHLMGGYDAGYYGYLWSEVYSADMFTMFQKDILSSEVGERYRKIMLERGNMVDGQTMLLEFLGRPSNNQAFLDKLHIHGQQ